MKRLGGWVCVGVHVAWVRVVGPRHSPVPSPISHFGGVMGVLQAAASRGWVG